MDLPRYTAVKVLYSTDHAIPIDRRLLNFDPHARLALVQRLVNGWVTTPGHSYSATTSLAQLGWAWMYLMFSPWMPLKALTDLGSLEGCQGFLTWVAAQATMRLQTVLPQLLCV